MTRERFIAGIMHLGWWSYCNAIGQVGNIEPTESDLDSTYDQIRFLDANPDAPDSANHDNWMKKRIADGWKYGPIKDKEKKEHPDLVPFDQLPPEEQMKDTNSMVFYKAACKLWAEMEAGQ